MSERAEPRADLEWSLRPPPSLPHLSPVPLNTTVCDARSHVDAYVCVCVCVRVCVCACEDLGDGDNNRAKTAQAKAQARCAPPPRDSGNEHGAGAVVGAATALP